MNHASFTRRDVLKAGGALVVSFMMPGPVDTALGQTPTTIGSRPPLTPDELDSWVAVLPDGSVTAFFGKMDMGQGVDTAIGQIVADELDVAFDRVQVVMGDTAFTCNQGGASGSTGIQNGGVTLRYAAAEARRLLVERAAQRLAVPVEKLTVQDGVVSVIGDARRTASYGELIGGGHFHHKLDWNQKYGNPLLAKGQAAPKKPSDYTIVGKSIPQKIVTEKVYGTLRYVTDVKVDGMLHARIIRPPAAGCGPVAVDESSIAGIPGVRIVREKELVAVVAEHEWDAVRAATATPSCSACRGSACARSGSRGPDRTVATMPATPPWMRRSCPGASASRCASSTCGTTRPAGTRRGRRASTAGAPASTRRATS